ncbi:Hypothetical predicted protein [Lecanosticta acicola]|uniref:Protein transport protein sec16 n=1 Tax=Lecanosticta acicola TaxID=111012 RepID=A0AAI8Z531_9PEZI|nr:Hypothetical predicted protein [Lecanosticta acicola]
MSDDGYPNFGNAWTSTSSTSASNSASWNPAFRPNTDSLHARNTSTASNDDFFERYPGPTPEKSRARAQEPVEEEAEYEELPTAARKRSSIAVLHTIERRTDAATSGDLSRVPAVKSQAEGSPSRRDSIDAADELLQQGDPEDDEEEGAIFHPNETAVEQEHSLESKLQVPGEHIFIGTPGTQTPMPLEKDYEAEFAKHNRSESGYEHQGEALEMEEAIDEAPEAPLLDDPEEPPTVETLQREPIMRAVSGESVLDDERGTTDRPLSKGSDQIGHVQRSFTTNFTEVPAQEKTQEEVPEPVVPMSDGWPSAGDDKTFGELLGDKQIVANTTANYIDELHVAPVDDAWGAGTSDDAQLIGAGRTSSSRAEPTSIFAQKAEETPGVEAFVIAPDAEQEDDLAAMWQAALDDDDLLEETNDLDPSKFFGDDDLDFLDDDPLLEHEVSALAPAPASTQPTPAQAPRTASYVPNAAATAATQPSQLNRYAAPGPQILAQSHGRTAGTPSTGLYDLYGQGAPQQAQASQRPSAQSAQSFVDKAKGGYESPYDLPMEVVKPRQRPRPVAGPRSSSISGTSGQQQSRPPTAAGQNFIQPSSSGSVPAAPPPTSTTGVVSAKSTPKTDAGFFADLPFTEKPRARVSGAYTPQPQNSFSPPAGPMPPRGTAAPPVQHPQRPQAPATPAQQQQVYGGLTRHQESLPLLPDQPTASVQSQPPAAPPPNQRYSPSNLPAPAQVQSRYSPAPTAQSQAPVSRYSPAPSSQAKKYGPAPGAAPAPPPFQHAHPFAPRTSSPLAFQQDKHQGGMSGSPPKTIETGSSGTMSPERSISMNYSPIDQRTASISSLASPPQRSATQSPPNVRQVPRYSMQSQMDTHAQASGLNTTASRSMHLPHRRQFSRDISFAAPQDFHAEDSLQRWKGAPVFRWGESGMVVSSFPKQTPFYAAGGAPTIKCTPGPIAAQLATTFMPMDECNAKFPGPLAARAKSKKKEVLVWMSNKIDDLGRRNEHAKNDFQLDVDVKKRTEEKLLLWKIVKIFVEHDGHLEGDKKIEDEIRAVLLPDLAQMSQVMELQSPLSSSTTGLQADVVDKTVIFQLRQALLEGQRERAVWLAEEKKLWGHAMLIASTMGPDMWKQIIQSFVRSQVKTVGSDARSLAALYQVFAGNAEECVDELVPPSARAGFQMISKSDGTINGNPLEGLDKWRETLGLVAGNRTPADGQSLLSLGKLLDGYGRAEAAHTCYLFARQIAKHSGADDAEVSFVILGANHHGQQESFANDLDAIILTEIYEWATSLSAPSSAVHYIPHLQSFKLIHAQELAAYGLKAKAQAYCDHITSAYTSTTRPSQYYHPTFTQSVSDLSAFLSQTPQAGSSGLLSKGAMNKVSSGAASWFTKFVSGDDDQDSTGSGPGAGSEDMISGPFGRVNGDSPDLSRTASGTDLYNPMMGGGGPYAPAQAVGTSLGVSPQQAFAPSSAPSKYAPVAAASKYAPMAAGGMGAAAQRPASPHRPASSLSAVSYAPAPVAQALGVPRPDANRAASDYSASYNSATRRGSAPYPGSQSIYEPRPMLAEETSSYGYQPAMPDSQSRLGEEQLDPFAKPNGIREHDEFVADAEGGGYQPPSMSYEPPSSGGGYEPPSYQPYEPEPELAGDEAKPMQKSFMDDDENDVLAQQAAAMKKAEADREADEAFRKAAEADAERDKAKSGGQKKGWLPSVGGWFGGGAKKDAHMPTVHKAKLGEENSFYYDEQLKKWVNKKGGAEAATPAAATPPPPKCPPGRAVSAAMGPPSGPPSRVSSGIGLAGRPPPGPPSSMGGTPSGPPSRSGTPASGDSGLPMPAGVAALNGSGSGSRPPSAPPSRPATSMSNASSLDDLLGGPPGPGQRKAGGTVKGKKKGGRYVDVMQSK